MPALRVCAGDHPRVSASAHECCTFTRQQAIIRLHSLPSIPFILNSNLLTRTMKVQADNNQEGKTDFA